MMNKTFTADDGSEGNITLQEYKGQYYPPDSLQKKHYDRLKTFDVDATDVIICSYPKSGLHWLWEVTSMIVKNKTIMSKDLMVDNILNFVPLRLIQKLPVPRVLTAHLTFDDLPESVRIKKCKVINIIRDPRGIAASGYNFFTKLKSCNWNGTWNGYLNLQLRGKVPFGDWFSFTRSWEKSRELYPGHPIYIMHYEDVLQNPFAELKRLAAFLQVDITDAKLQTVADQTSFSSMKATKDEASKTNFIRTFFEEDRYPLFRKGALDDWKNYFTLQQNEDFEQRYKKEMGGFKLKLKSMLTPGSLETGCVEVAQYGPKL